MILQYEQDQVHKRTFDSRYEVSSTSMLNERCAGRYDAYFCDPIADYLVHPEVADVVAIFVPPIRASWYLQLLALTKTTDQPQQAEVQVNAMFS